MPKKNTPIAQPTKVEAKIDKSPAKSNGKAPKQKIEYPVIFNEWETTGRQMFRVIADTWKGKVLFSVRKYWYDKADELQPGKGATVGYEDIDEIITGLQKMKKWMEENPKE